MATALAYPKIRPETVALVGFISFTATALSVGTGGQPTADYYKQRGLMGYALAPYHSVQDEQADLNRSPTENLAYIRATLGPSVTDLAFALDVSRQAIYDWNSGKPIAPSNAARLADLAKVTEMFSAAGVKASSAILRRPIVAGASILDVLRDRGQAADAARKLLQIVQREGRQRERLTVKFAGRPTPIDPMEDYGSPMLDEAD